MSKYIDLFAGCGGLSLGLYNAGWQGLFAIENSVDAFATLEHNLIKRRNHFDWPNWLPIEPHDINKIIEKYKKELRNLEGKIHLVAGGPPCQGFSIAGKRKEDDERNKLVDSYINFIKLIKPTLIFFENVKGFTAGFKNNETRGKAYSLYVWESLEALGYDVYGKVVDFAEYGIPQRRKRFILVGIIDGNAESFFDRLDKNRGKFFKAKGLNLNPILEEAISDLLRKNGFCNSPDSKSFKAGYYSKAKSDYQRYMRNGISQNGQLPDSHRFPNHKTQTEEKFRYILSNLSRGKNIVKELNGQYKTKKSYVVLLDENQPSPTVTSLPDDYIHYSEPRILTVREFARIQSFPDWFKFKGKYTTGNILRRKEVPRYTQVGNAIPPLFAEQCGLVLREYLKNG